MTGWQSGGGDQGGWDPNQSFGPEAQTNKYGTDPYTSPDPYGADPYGNQYGQANPYGTDPYPGGYDQYQQYPPSGGFPAQGYGPPPPPPPKRSKLPMVLSLVAIVIIVGAVVAIVLVNRDGGQPVAEQDETSSAKTPSTTESGESSSSAAPTSTSGGGDRDDWLTIDNTGKSGLSYQVPPDWKQSSEPTDSGLEVDFTGVADYGTYECEGKSYFRSRVASGDVQGSGGKDLDLPTTVEDFADSFAKVYYGENARVEAPAPVETTVDGKPAMTLTAKVTVPDAGNCAAAEAEVAMVGVQVQEEGQPKGVAMLVVANDLAGGPADPKPLDPSVSQEILSTVSAG